MAVKMNHRGTNLSSSTNKILKELNLGPWKVYKLYNREQVELCILSRFPTNDTSKKVKTSDWRLHNVSQKIPWLTSAFIKLRRKAFKTTCEPHSPDVIVINYNSLVTVLLYARLNQISLSKWASRRQIANAIHILNTKFFSRIHTRPESIHPRQNYWHLYFIGC